MTRTFEARPAERRQVNLFIGLVGASSSGKTMSALLLASGIQKVTGGDIYFIDTENRRATFYSDMFKFQHVQFDAPYGSLDYVEAIKHCEAKGAKIIVIDSASHEHEGEGGMLEFQEAEVVRMAGDDMGKRERVKMLAWQKPKAARRRLLRKIITSKANIIVCFRAKHISKPVKVNGETKVVDQGFVPIAGEEFVFEMQLCCLLPPNSQGVPNWSPEAPGERLAVKLPVQFKNIVQPGEPITAALGTKLAEWARGGAAEPVDRETLVKKLKTAASYGSASLKTDWDALTKDERKTVGEATLKELQADAKKADEEA